MCLANAAPGDGEVFSAPCLAHSPGEGDSPAKSPNRSRGRGCSCKSLERAVVGVRLGVDARTIAPACSPAPAARIFVCELQNFATNHTFASVKLADKDKSPSIHKP